jgi:ketosteroid isomerase-like protein
VKLEDLEKRIHTLEDIEKVKNLQIRYCNALIQTKWDELIDCFADDAIVDLHMGYCKGKKEFSKLFKESVSKNHKGQEGNFAVHPIVTVNGDTAKGSWLHYIQFAQPRKLSPKPDNCITDDAPNWMQGYYDMEYKKVKGEWKISMLKWRCRLISPLTNLIGYKPQ